MTDFSLILPTNIHVQKSSFSWLSNTIVGFLQNTNVLRNHFLKMREKSINFYSQI